MATQFKTAPCAGAPCASERDLRRGFDPTVPVSQILAWRRLFDKLLADPHTRTPPSTEPATSSSPPERRRSRE
jgi:hypothetical protein